MKLYQTISSFFLTFVCHYAVCAKFTSDMEFVAAVYEHAFVGLKNATDVMTRREALNIVMNNMNVYEQQILKAKAQNASFIVFPEYGLSGYGLTRDSFQPFLENIPDPMKREWNACKESRPDNSTAILNRLSCLAKDNDIYIVVSMGDIKPCSKIKDPLCPADGRYQYNTNVVFDSQGKLIARYHKQHLFLNEMKFVNRPVDPEFITFETPFGKFGTFTCFDVLFHDPAIYLVTKYNVDHVVFPTAWFDVLPLFAAIGFHSSWARGMGVNYLSSNTHIPALRNTGSGIYSSTGAKKFYRSMSDKGSLLIASLPVSRRNASHNKPQVKFNVTSKDFLSVGNKSDEFYSDLFGDLFLFKELREEEDTLNVCYNDTTTCCSLTYNMTDKRSDEMYALGVFDGLHTKEGEYYLRICAVIKCLNLNQNSCGQSVYNASSIFNNLLLKSQLNTSYVFPQVVADGVSLLPGEWNHNFPVTSLYTTQQLSKGLLTGALFGRVYHLDPTAPSPVPTTSTHPLTTSDSPLITGSTTSMAIPRQLPSVLLALICFFVMRSCCYV